MEPTPLEIEQHRAHVRAAQARAAWRWRWHDQCPRCGEWIGHKGACELIPLNVQLDELRAGCYDVRRPRIGDAIRAACERTT